MQALKVDLNPGSHLKSVKGSKHSKAGSTAKNDPGKNKKFAEVYEQLLALPQTAVSESKVKQLGNNKTLKQTGEFSEKRIPLPTALGQGVGSETKKRITWENEVKLISAGLSKQASNAGKNVSLTKSGTAATGEIPGSTAKPISNESIKLTGDEFKLVKTGEKKGSETAEAKVSHSAAKPMIDETIKPAGDEFKLIKAAEKKGSEAAEAKFSHSAAKPISDETRKTVGDEFKLIKAAEKKGNQAAEAKVSRSAAKPINDETRKPAGDEFKLLKATVKEGSEAEEVKLIKSEVKGGHLREIQDISGEVNRLQPDINNSQAMGKTEADKSIMSKSQMDFIVTNMAGQIKSGASSLEINLKPEYLGKIKLLLQMNEGSISIRIIAQTVETLNLLNSNVQNIQDNLEQQGIKLNDMIVDLANQEKQGNQTGSGNREKSKPWNYFRQSQESYDNIGSREHSSLQSNILNILA